MSSCQRLQHVEPITLAIGGINTRGLLVVTKAGQEDVVLHRRRDIVRASETVEFVLQDVRRCEDRG